ncbi:hypothetical protein QA601_02070 [Chitinispirillales bacterium ANBcel5]|uniref:hypothetical protein n=1 Tax=Cellulosispirillum alkaliphilum TaxID=3039283 RepID=UPI002A56E589|nr:hypothetical protein [Chitinispirillales bacterium ANBcel5]
MEKLEIVEVSRIRGTTLIKLILLGFTTGFSLLVCIFGFFAFLGFEVLHYNEQYITGFKALITLPFSVFIGFILALFSSFFTYIGLRLYSLFRGISIEYILGEETDQEIIHGDVED